MNARRLRKLWFGLLLRSFPKEFRSDNGPELLGFMQERTSWSALDLLRESLALLKAGLLVSFRTAANLPRDLQFSRGAAAWLGLLLGIGPVIRIAELRHSYGPETSGLDAAFAVTCMVAAIAVLPRSRIAGLSMVGLSLAFAARSTARGSWTVTDALIYEAAWLLPAVAAIVLAGNRRKRASHWPTLASAIVVGSTMTAMVHTDLTGGGSYGYALQSVIFDSRVTVLGLIVLSFAALCSPRVLSRLGLPLLQILTFAIAGQQFGIAIFTGCCLATIVWNARKQDGLSGRSPVIE